MDTVRKQRTLITHQHGHVNERDRVVSRSIANQGHVVTVDIVLDFGAVAKQLRKRGKYDAWL